jgi:hypothetical protein
VQHENKGADAQRPDLLLIAVFQNLHTKMPRSIVGLETHVRMDFCDTRERQFSMNLLVYLQRTVRNITRRRLAGQLLKPKP